MYKIFDWHQYNFVSMNVPLILNLNLVFSILKFHCFIVIVISVKPTVANTIDVCDIVVEQDQEELQQFLDVTHGES